MRRSSLSALLTLTFWLSVFPAALAASYTFTTVDVSFPGTLDTSANGINKKGQIVGRYIDSDEKGHGFLYDGGVFSTIDVPNATLTQANGINKEGQIVGVYADSDEKSHGFLATPIKGSGK